MKTRYALHPLRNAWYSFLARIEKMRGLDFYDWMLGEESGVRAEVGYTYESSHHVPEVKEIIQRQNPTSNDHILDLGCGKGGMLARLSKLGFGRVAGVEISPKLAEIARKNLKILNLNNVSVYESDAAFFEHLDEFNYFYCFNPFPCHVMRFFLQNLKASIERKPRTVTLIYYNPTCHMTILSHRLLHFTDWIEAEAAMIHVYKS